MDCLVEKRTLCYGLIVIILNINAAEPANVLFYNGQGGGSHYLVAAALAEEMVSRGHSVTFILSDVFKHRADHPVHSELFNFKFNKMTSFAKELESMMTVGYNDAFEGKNPFYNKSLVAYIAKYSLRECEILFESNIIYELKQIKFDVAVFDPVWPCCTAVTDYLAEKRVALITTSLLPYYVELMGNPINSATTPEFGLGLPENMNFYQRLQNIIVKNSASFIFMGTFDLYRHIFEPRGIKSHKESLRDVDLFITTFDPLIDTIIQYTPNHISAAGLTASTSNVLSQDLENFMESSGEHGVILFSIGSYAPSLPERLIKPLQTAFSNMKQKVIWHWKNKTPPSGMPDNVLLMEWFPQNDILGHNKTKLMFYHGGNNGLYEAIYHGVPILVFPLIVDQFDIAQRISEKEIGLKIDVTKMTKSQYIEEKLTTVLTDPKYQNNIRRMSTMFRDRPQTPRERAVDWIEHIIKYGSGHLQPPGRNLSFLEYNSIDVYGFILIVLLTVIVIFCVSIFFIFRQIRRYMHSTINKSKIH